MQCYLDFFYVWFMCVHTILLPPYIIFSEYNNWFRYLYNMQ